MLKLLRAYYSNKAAVSGQIVRGFLTHVDNGRGKPLCVVYGENFRDSFTRKTWESEWGEQPTCDRCKLKLSQQKPRGDVA